MGKEAPPLSVTMDGSSKRNVNEDKTGHRQKQCERKQHSTLTSKQRHETMEHTYSEGAFVARDGFGRVVVLWSTPLHLLGPYSRVVPSFVNTWKSPTFDITHGAFFAVSRND